MREQTAKPDFSHKPSAIESEIHPSHKSDDLYSVYFAIASSQARLLADGFGESRVMKKLLRQFLNALCREQIYASVNYKCCRIYGCAGYGNEFVNGQAVLSTHNKK